MSGLISGIVPQSIAEELELQAGDLLLSINGMPVTDIIDYDFLTADEYLELEIKLVAGETVIFEVEKDFDEPLGLIFAADVFDGIKSCANHCLFCFIDQQQPAPRDSLLLKDDDYRMSFLEGNFITATNLRPQDYQRIQSMRLSPLYISVHATDPKLRKELLGFKKDAAILPILQKLIGYGCELHTQIVLCPDINDGAVLAKTIADLRALHPGVRSAAVVPVGLTRFQTNPRLRLFAQEEAASLLRYLEGVQQECLAQYGDPFVFPADELYVKAGLPFPDAALYGDFAQIENGIGMAALFLADWQKVGQTLPKSLPLSKKTAILTGVNGAAVLRPALEEWIAASSGMLELIVAENSFYGPTVTATGLLTGSCLCKAVAPGQYQRVLIPENMLKFDSQLFLDDMTVAQVAQALQAEVLVVPTTATALAERLCAE